MKLGDPAHFHAHFCVTLVEPTQPLRAADIACRGRLAGAVKKMAVLATVTHSSAETGSLNTATMEVATQKNHDKCFLCQYGLNVSYLTMDWGWAS